MVRHEILADKRQDWCGKDCRRKNLQRQNLDTRSVIGQAAQGQNWSVYLSTPAFTSRSKRVRIHGWAGYPELGTYCMAFDYVQRWATGWINLKRSPEGRGAGGMGRSVKGMRPTPKVGQSK